MNVRPRPGHRRRDRPRGTPRPVRYGSGRPSPETPGKGIVPGAFPARPTDDPRSIPEDILARRDRLTLADVLDVALRNDPATQIAWRDARSRADALGAAKADWWPDLDVTLGGDAREDRRPGRAAGQYPDHLRPRARP